VVAMIAPPCRPAEDKPGSAKGPGRKKRNVENDAVLRSALGEQQWLIVPIARSGRAGRFEAAALQHLVARIFRRAVQVRPTRSG
jgi:hypothetical protein